MCSIDHLVSKMLNECGCAAAEISSHLGKDVFTLDQRVAFIFVIVRNKSKSRHKLIARERLIVAL